jgi:hypothetical protein
MKKNRSLGGAPITDRSRERKIFKIGKIKIEIKIK